MPISYQDYLNNGKDMNIAQQQQPGLCCAPNTADIPLCFTVDVSLDFGTGSFSISLGDATCAPCDCFVECIEVDFSTGIFHFLAILPLTAHISVCIDPQTGQTFCNLENVTC